MSNIITFPISKSMALRHFNNRLNAEMAKIHANVAEIAVEFGSVEAYGEHVINNFFNAIKDG